MWLNDRPLCGSSCQNAPNSHLKEDKYLRRYCVIHFCKGEIMWKVACQIHFCRGITREWLNDTFLYESSCKSVPKYHMKRKDTQLKIFLAVLNQGILLIFHLSIQIANPYWVVSPPHLKNNIKRPAPFSVQQLNNNIYDHLDNSKC